jgi:CubicO group peptidase (beta-lactamase class C family)
MTLRTLATSLLALCLWAASHSSTAAQEARQWTMTGEVSRPLAELDTAVRTFMIKHKVRGGAFAIAKDGRLLLSHGYTFGAAGYPVVQPTTLFRIGSVSKAFTDAALFELMRDKRLTPQTRVFEYLGIDRPALPGQKVDPRIHTITLQHLIDNKAGWDKDKAGFDIGFESARVSRALHLNSAPTLWDAARYWYGEPLQFTPGQREVYCNFCAMLTGLMIEKATGKTYYQAIEEIVLRPLGIVDVRVAQTLHQKRLPNEVATYDALGVGPSIYSPNVQRMVPRAYGGYGGYPTELSPSTGGLAASAPAVVGLIAHYTAWGLGLRPKIGPGGSLARAGSLDGTSAFAVSLGSGVDYAFALNTRDFGGDDHALDALVDRLNGLAAQKLK